MHKKGYTLAEVLVTLGIIGVVAAMTLPSLIQNYKKHVVETRLKHAYNVLSNIILKNREQMGEASEWPVENAESFVKNRMLAYIDGGKLLKSQDVTKYKNSVTEGYFGENNPNKNIAGLQLQSGEIIVVPLGFYESDRTINILLNNNKDNNYFPGKDYFVFLFKKTTTNIKPYYDCNTNKQTLYTKCKNGTTSACTSIIVCNGWKIPNDYPVKL